MQKILSISLLLMIFALPGAYGAADPGRQWISFGDKLLPQAASDSRIDQGVDQRVVQENVPGMWIRRRSQALRLDSAGSDSSFYDEVAMPGFSYLREEGSPKVPFKTYMMEVGSTNVPTVHYRALATTTISNLNLVPVQPLPPDVYPAPEPPPFMLNREVYDEDGFYPAANPVSVSVAQYGERYLLTIAVAPVRVNPVDQTAVVDYQYEIVVDEGAPMRLDAATDASTDLPIYMILTDDQYAAHASLATFMDWKRRKGNDVRLVLTSEINANGAPSSADIVSYMRGLSDADYPDYLLIIGDADPASGVAGEEFNTHTTTYYGYTDLPVACRTSTDYLPDLYHGRLPASSSGELTTMLAKVIAMDRNPPNSSMYQKVVVAGQIQDSDDTNNQADRLFCETADSLASYFESNPNGYNYTVTRAIVNPSGMTAAGLWNANSILWNGTEQIGARIADSFVSVATAQDRITDNVNAGIALLQHRDHGYVNGVGWGDPHYLYSHVNGLSNGEDRPVVFSVNCNSGMYNFPNNFAKSWLINGNGGAYAVFAPVDTSYSWLNDWLTHGFYAAFLDDYISEHNASVAPDWPKDLPAPSGSFGVAGSARRLGEILNFGKMYMREKYWSHEETFKLFHLFGDPEAYLRIKTPQAVTVSHPSSLLGRNHTITVNVSDNDSVVALYSETLGIHQRAIPSGGQASFSITNSASGDVAVTVTGPEIQTYEGTIALTIPVIDFKFSASALADSVLLRWTDPTDYGKQRDDVMIRASTNGYPVSAADGRAVYSGTNQVFIDAGLPPDIQQCYSIWLTDDGVNYVAP